MEEVLRIWVEEILLPIVISACNTHQRQYTSSHKAAETAWNGPQECVEEMRQAFHRRRDLLVSLMREIPGLEVNNPEGAFYLFPKCSSFFERLMVKGLSTTQLTLLCIF